MGWEKSERREESCEAEEFEESTGSVGKRLQKCGREKGSKSETGKGRSGVRASEECRKKVLWNCGAQIGGGWERRLIFDAEKVGVFGTG